LNLPDFLDQEVALETSLRRVLANWGERQRPAAHLRGHILEQAASLAASLPRRSLMGEARQPFSSSLAYQHQWRLVSIWVNF
jgi:hypothetical protein